VHLHTHNGKIPVRAISCSQPLDAGNGGCINGFENLLLSEVNSFSKRGELRKGAIMVFKDPDLDQLVYNFLSFGTAVMLGAFVYFLTQIKSVAKPYQSGVAVSAVVVGIAGYHYFRMWSGWAEGTVNEGYRYADWLITVPLLIVELLIVLGVTADRRKKLMLILVPATILMIGLGYPGEVSTEDGTKWLFWILAMLPFAVILAVLSTELKAARARETGAISSSIRNATGVLLVTWMVYPVAYLFPVIFDAGHEGAETARQIGYTFADITAKCLYGLMILQIAKARSGDSH
jgi:bacteriorhodopsin